MVQEQQKAKQREVEMSIKLCRAELSWRQFVQTESGESGFSIIFLQHFIAGRLTTEL